MLVVINPMVHGFTKIYTVLTIIPKKFLIHVKMAGIKFCNSILNFLVTLKELPSPGFRLFFLLILVFSFT